MRSISLRESALASVARRPRIKAPSLRINSLERRTTTFLDTPRIHTIKPCPLEAHPEVSTYHTQCYATLNS